MRVLIFVPDNKSLGGVHMRALAVAHELELLEKVFISFAVTDDKGSRVFSDEASRQGFTAHVIKGTSRPKNSKFLLLKIFSVVNYITQLPVSIFSCVRLIRSIRPDIVHVNGLMNIVPIIASKPFRKIRCLHHLIGNHYSKPILSVYSLLSQLADDHIYISAKLQDYYTRYIPALGHILMEPIPRGIVQRELLRSELTKITVIGCVANYTPAKNWDLWIEVAQALSQLRPELQFVCIGKEVRGHEQYFQSIKEKSNNLNIHWTGFRGDILGEISKFDLFLLTSNYEGTPLVLLEAASVMTPIVTSVTGGITDMFERDEVCFIPEQKPNIYLEAILKLIDNPVEANKMAEKARKRIESDYRLKSHTEKLMTIYYDLSK